MMWSCEKDGREEIPKKVFSWNSMAERREADPRKRGCKEQNIPENL